MTTMHPDEYEMVALEALSAGFATVEAYLEWLDCLDAEALASE